MSPHLKVASSTTTMIYDQVDNYYPSGLDDNSVRMNKHDELSDFSSQSILCAMDRFVKAVNNMNETVMVPCRLLDMEVDRTKDPEKVPNLLRSDGNTYNLYTTLNTLKNDLIWGPTSNDDDESDYSSNSSLPSSNTRYTSPQYSSSSSTASGGGGQSSAKGHFRRQSTLSMISVSSSTSEGDSEGGCDVSEGGDSGLEDNSNISSNDVTDVLRTHLLGLHSCLSDLTHSATYITDRYQEEVNV